MVILDVNMGYYSPVTSSQEACYIQYVTYCIPYLNATAEIVLEVLTIVY